MAGRASDMRSSAEGMRDAVLKEREVLNGMVDGLANIAAESKDDAGYGDRVAAHIKDIAGRFEVFEPGPGR